MRGVTSNIRAQSDLVTYFEACAIKPLDIRPERSQGLTIETIFVLEEFGRDLEDHELDSFIIFMIRLLRMMEQRALIHSDIKPGNILYDDSQFKLSDFDDAGLYAYASEEVQERVKKGDKITAEEWKRHDLHCAGITICKWPL
eukprot:TRINITY_DN7238_c0_g1_i1.p1 TRINITY_DN7238_c0_g1~~TRINITY_DN7238_c0_g1_i1.p1  ORF type:complete len:143 (+),score=18.79 TRINITY_DN7238_c0_g1_i1:315-743(+)